LNGDIGAISTFCGVIKTDDKGQFRIVAQDKPYQLVVVHQTGFAHFILTPDESIPAQVRLQAWARAEGILRVGGTPVPNASIEIQGVGPNSGGSEGPRIFTTWRVLTDDQGRYSINRVFPGHGRIGREIMMMVVEGALDFTSTCMTPVDFVSGETAKIDFGQVGRPVIGKLQNADVNTKTDWKQILIEIRPFLPELPPLNRPPKIPAEVAIDKTKREAWIQTWLQSEDGKSFTALQNAHQANDALRETKLYFRATLNTDGEFRFDDVPEGEYTIKKLFSSTGQRLTVPPMQGARMDEPLDLGVLMLE
jgi:hypothetical protein